MEVPFDSDRWEWGSATRTAAELRGRPCVRLEGFPSPVTVAGLELQDGVVELELAVEAGRSFHGVVWRLQDAESYESFFVRPHQVGNPDSIQYTPVHNGLSAWQLYHGEGFWHPTAFPVGDWFRIRVAFAGRRAEIHVAGERVLAASLKRPVAAGRLGVLVGGEGLHLAGLSYDLAAPALPEPPPAAAVDGIVEAWQVSDPFGEELLTEPALDRGLLGGRTWTLLDAEPSGLVDLARAHGLRDGRNTVLARTTVRSELARTARLDLGFSDRAVVYLNGRALYRGDDAYRSRDYRFLGSIGWYDSVYLELAAGDNDLVVAVSEDFGGWGLQARFGDRAGPEALSARPRT